MTVEIFSSQLLFMHFVCMYVCSDVCHLLKNSEFKNFASELITHLIRLNTFSKPPHKLFIFIELHVNFSNLFSYINRYYLYKRLLLFSNKLKLLNS